ncbi:MAG: hypothetical protein Q8P67_17795, partial [archaeon]|nr:hypothetical protein [archaeon]
RSQNPSSQTHNQFFSGPNPRWSLAQKHLWIRNRHRGLSSSSANGNRRCSSSHSSELRVRVHNSSCQPSTPSCYSCGKLWLI